MFTGMLEAAMPLCRTPEERLFIQQFALERTVLDFLHWHNPQRLSLQQLVVDFLHRPSDECNSSGNLIAECLERLKYEGNTHLLGVEDLPPILQELQRRPDQKLLDQSLMRRVIYRIRQRYRMARVIYPRSRTRRVTYQARHLREMLKNKMSGFRGVRWPMIAAKPKGRIETPPTAWRKLRQHCSRPKILFAESSAVRAPLKAKRPPHQAE